MDIKRSRGIYILLALAIFIISFAGILIKLSSAHPFIIAFYRMLFSTLILTPYFFFHHRDKLHYFFDYRPAGVGFLLAVHFILWISAFEFTSVANAVIIVSLQPLFSIILEFFFAREDLKKGVLMGIIMALVGCIIISAGDLNLLFNKVWGDLLAFISAFFMSAYLFVGRGLRRDLDYFPYLYIVYSYAALIIGIFVLISGFSFTGFENVNYLYFLGLAIGPTLVGHSILNYSVRYVPTSVVSLTILGEPVITTILAWIILGEVITLVTFWGGAFILGGIYLAIIRRSRQQKTA